MKMNLNEISLELLSMVGILNCLSLADESDLNTKDLINLLDNYTNLNLEARETIGPLIQNYLN